MKQMTHGSLFSGIGGFDYASQKMGWKNLFHCEINPFARKILQYYWPKSHSYENIKTTDFTIWRGKIDILTGGFPCQPFSNAGKRKGTADNRHLWPEMLRAIQEIQPEWIVGENVYGIINWSNGMVFDQVQADLEASGYEVQPYVLPAAAVNAPHRRDRVWFVAHTNGANKKSNKRADVKKKEVLQRKNESYVFGELSCYGDATYPDSVRSGRVRNEKKTPRSQKSDELFGSECRISGKGRLNVHANGKRRRELHLSKKSTSKKFATRANNEKHDYWRKFPTQHPICSGNDGISTQLDGITFSKWRNESIKAYGNAIVPQVALQIFKTVQEMNRNFKNEN